MNSPRPFSSTPREHFSRAAAVSAPFGELAEKLHAEVPRNPERTVALTPRGGGAPLTNAHHSTAGRAGVAFTVGPCGGLAHAFRVHQAALARVNGLLALGNAPATELVPA